MPCIPIPQAPIPEVPDGLTISAPLPLPPSVNVPNPCCLLPDAPILEIPALLAPLTVNPAFMATIRAALQKIKDYRSKLPLRCPKS